MYRTGSKIGETGMTRTLTIDSCDIDDGSDAYVIAEIGHNHQGDITIAKAMFKAAAECGANAVKLQKRDNRSLFTRAYYDRPYDNENSYGATYGKHREHLEFSEAEYRVLQVYADSIGITFFATAFDIPSADFLYRLDMPAYKFASADLVNIPLLTHVAAFGKPMLISTGGGTIEDVDRAVDAVRSLNNRICLLQSTAGYPPAYEELNLRVISTYRERYPDTVIGYSGHDSGIAMGLVSYVLGARVIEKHFTLDRASKGTDHAFSLERPGLRKLVRDLRRARAALGDGVKRPYPSEAAAVRKLGKQLVASRGLAVGHVVTAADVAIKSPGEGLPPYAIDAVIGGTLSRTLEADEAFTLECLS